MDNGIEEGLKLLYHKASDELAEAIALNNDTDICIRTLNTLVKDSWSFAIVDSGTSLNEDDYVLQGRLYIIGLGFRDGIGTGRTVGEAKMMALMDAVQCFGIPLRTGEEQA